MQRSPFPESIQDALGAVVAALGGPKVVGARLWPEKGVEEAGRLLRHCLNPDRAEKLSLEQLLWLLRAGREAGAHDAMLYLAGESGYHAQPLEPEDERALLMRQFVQAQEQFARLAKQMERVGIVKAVA